MKKVILSEEQIKKVIDVLISEQQASEFAGGTDAQKVTHALLSKNFGLPDGAKNETTYYGANVADVINMSGTGERSKYLSVFKPANKYSEDPKSYYDSILINGEKLENSGSKTFNFVKGNVYATHNGLLALTRAMDHMGGRGGILTISFGKNTTGKDAQTERIGGGVKFDSNRAMNQSPIIGTLEEMLVSLAVSPEFRKLGAFVAVKNDTTNEETITNLPNIIRNIGMGVYGFMDVSKKDEIIKNLTPKGFITNVDVNINNIVQKLTPLQKVEDKEWGDSGGYTEYNQNKRNQLNTIGSSFEPNLIETLKSTYMKNFQIYVENYLPNSAPQLIPMIKNVKFNYDGLGGEHYSIFHRKITGSVQSKSAINQTNTSYKSGN